VQTSEAVKELRTKLVFFNQIYLFSTIVVLTLFAKGCTNYVTHLMDIFWKLIIFSLNLLNRHKNALYFLRNRKIRKKLIFQCSLFLRIPTLLTWLKSTLLLKNKCFDTTIYMKTQCLQTNEIQHNGKGKCLRSRRWSRERVALIKSLIYGRWKRDALEGQLPNRAENVNRYIWE